MPGSMLKSSAVTVFPVVNQVSAKAGYSTQRHLPGVLLPCFRFKFGGLRVRLQRYGTFSRFNTSIHERGIHVHGAGVYLQPQLIFFPRKCRTSVTWLSNRPKLNEKRGNSTRTKVL